MVNKPSTMTMKEWLVKKLSMNINTPEKIINVVIANQFDTANDAVGLHDSVEISGFGKFIFNQSRAKKRMIKYIKEKKYLLRDLEHVENDKEKDSLEQKLKVMNINIKVLKPRIHENKPSVRGLEKPPVSSPEIKGDNKGDQ